MRNILLACVLLLAAVPFAFGQSDDTLKGIELYQSGKFKEAAAVLQAVVKADSKNTLAWMYLGGSLQNLGDKKEALKAVKKSAGGKKSSMMDESNLPEYESEIKILRKPKLQYTDEARTNEVQGKIRLAVEFKPDGTIGFILPVKGLSFGLTENAINAAKLISFEPAVSNGVKVTVIRSVEYTFTIY